MKRTFSFLGGLLLAVLCLSPVLAAEKDPPRERLLMDSGWRFAFGHPFDPDKDFAHGTAFFSYFAKAGTGDGPASPKFDDRSWRQLDLPHDWAVELPFDEKGSYSHGYKAMGRKIPEKSVGWYRKTFTIPASDKGRRISIDFDGVHRDALVWVNGFYMGRESSGYSGFRYDISDVLNYGGENTVAVRVDTTLEEGWFYEGAGIYRHVWLTKTAPLHVDHDGTFVSCEVSGDSADITIRTTVSDEMKEKAAFELDHQVLDASGRVVGSLRLKKLSLAPGASEEFTGHVKLQHPNLWSPETPSLYKVLTRVVTEGSTIDATRTTFGVRTVSFDPDKGFFLNGKHVELKGTCNHQDHAGVGCAMPDALQEFRIKSLKEFGANAYRCSHNPPTPELLDACDRLGMLVLVENRLMGNSPELQDRLKRLILRDRNHPCVFAWSLGNEEWAIEGDIKGAQIAAPSQDFVRRLDPTRHVTCAISGGWGNGISTVIDVMGFNYQDHGNVDDYHKKNPAQSSFATEETTTHDTRGIYENDGVYGHLVPTDRTGAESIEYVWNYYVARPWMGGLFLWTGFDYRGEETPFRYPAISSQYGVLDTCGFPKDAYYYLKSWWGDKPVLFITPHWNWKDKEGKPVHVWVRGNCEEVELFLNGKSLGKKTMPVNSHLEWEVPYEAGTLSAKGYKAGLLVSSDKVETTGIPESIVLTPDRAAIKADGEDISVVTVKVNDAQGRAVPTAANDIQFSIEGPGKIIGVGNGDPVSHEADKSIETVSQVKITGLKMRDGGPLGKRDEVAFDVDDSKWPVLFSGRADDQGKVTQETPSARVVRGSFDIPSPEECGEITLFPRGLVDAQSIYVNGHLVAEKLGRDDDKESYPLPKSILRKGRNVYAVVGKELLRRRVWEELNQDPGSIRMVVPASAWKRSLFSGLAQVIVQSDKKAGDIVLKASSKGLTSASLKLSSKEVPLRASVP